MQGFFPVPFRLKRLAHVSAIMKKWYGEITLLLHPISGIYTSDVTEAQIKFRKTYWQIPLH